ncbi:Uncharacterised protein [Clostridium tetani]|uniref:hypothetical protein n=3 Tax=Clostridium tetani TaxID=1513 RepID=UPI000E12C85E|nr:hypothetical protein [Clostridium tetani]RXI42353.1 hypothetical protein DP129_00035 [Clostridium tetani]RXI56646.1 hypothetical protein DP122_01740 [Clostridium tetani]RXI78346.1 hypothetical protein DP128_00865 [Clostridium tetani]SUY56771.1 Uncharacterised protein [Clostridium tetani]BDR78895.1 hypothetical protein K154307017_18280 [Clostridium tetani]
MAGYVFSINDVNSLKKCIENGIYSTNLSEPKNKNWGIHHEGTFADYISMKPGDNIYFFIDRKIYGIGELIKIGQDCKYKNYTKALDPINGNYNNQKDNMIININEKNINNRVFCLFRPSPNFFQCGIDMDDVLSSNPSKFRMLRAFWKLSFIKIDNEENKALKDIILKRNEEFINTNEGVYNFNNYEHDRIQRIVNHKYSISSKEILKWASKCDYIRHEMALEAGIIDYILNINNGIFGNWDYISHQVIASPFKPIDYMDKMDVFGYKYISGFDTVSKYLVIEIKKDKAIKDGINQVMKYVDWVNQEYSFGDYSMIEAFVVAYDFSEDIINYRNEVCVRNYVMGRRPAICKTWRSVKLIKYRYDAKNEKVLFKEVN